MVLSCDYWGTSAISEVLIRRKAMEPLVGDRLSYLAVSKINVTWTWTWTWTRISNRVWMPEIKVCWWVVTMLVGMLDFDWGRYV